MVELLFNAWPEAIFIQEKYGDLPLHRLCRNEQLDEITSLAILRFMLLILI